MDEKQQLELFPEIEPKRTTWREHKVLIPLDRLILLLAILPILLVFSYSAGVKKGKEIKSTTQPQVPNTRITAETLQEKEKLPDVHEEYILDVVEKEEVDDSNKEIAITKGNLSNAYAVQLATYKKKGFLQKEKQYLEKNGYTPIITEKGPYTVLLIGTFSNKNDAKKALEFLRGRYKDCYIRRM